MYNIKISYLFWLEISMALAYNYNDVSHLSTWKVFGGCVG